MTFKQRLPYYLFGLGIGIIVVIFIWNKKGTEFNYGPNSRVLKNIRIKNRVFSNEALSTLNSKDLDTSIVSKILKNGKADMWNKIQSDTCTEYNIKGKKELKNVTLTIKNCGTTAFVEKITID